METEEGTSIVWLWADKLLYLYFYPEELSSSGVHVTFFLRQRNETENK